MSRIARQARRFSELLWIWVPLAIVAGLLVPGFAELEPLALVLLALIVGGVAVTLDLAGFKDHFSPRLLPWLFAHVLMIGVAWTLGKLLALPAIHMAGLVLLGASTPDLTAPLLSRIAHADTHATLLLLMSAGVLSILLIPLSVVILIDPTLRVPLNEVLTVVAIGILLPLLAGIALQWLAPETMTRVQHHATAVSTLATLLVTALVAAMNRDVILQSIGTLPFLRLVAAAAGLITIGLLLGHLVGRTRPALHHAGLFIPGTREYALAAALILATGFPPEAAVLPLIFGAIQMVVAPLLAYRLAHNARTHR